MATHTRTVATVDAELREAVAARADATKMIRQLSDAVVYNTKKISQLLDERLTLDVAP